MGTPSTPKYRLEYATGLHTTFIKCGVEWNCRKSGRPSPKNVTKYLDGMNDSFGSTGCNTHLRDTDEGYTWVRGRVVRQSDGKVMCEGWTSRLQPARRPTRSVTFTAHQEDNPHLDLSLGLLEAIVARREQVAAQ